MSTYLPCQAKKRHLHSKLLQILSSLVQTMWAVAVEQGNRCWEQCKTSRWNNVGMCRRYHCKPFHTHNLGAILLRTGRYIDRSAFFWVTFWWGYDIVIRTSTLSKCLSKIVLEIRMKGAFFQFYPPCSSLSDRICPLSTSGRGGKSIMLCLWRDWHRRRILVRDWMITPGCNIWLHRIV